MEAQTKNCQNCKKDFTIEPADFAFYEKMQVPPPTWCPKCRMVRRMAFRNERKLFRGTDGRLGKPFVSFWDPAGGYTVYFDKDWWNRDLWDPRVFGQEFDPARPFLAQLFELNKKVPKSATDATNMVNSDYSGNASNLKNCYLCFNSNFSEDCGYGNGIDYTKNSYDNSHIQKCDRCYGSFWLTNCYEVFFSSQCVDSSALWFSKDCRSCSDCFGCVNLRSKKYCWFNEQLTKEEYLKRLAEANLGTWSGISVAREKAHAFWLKFPNKFMQGTNNVDVSGEYISNSKNAKNSYLIREVQDVKYVQYSQVPSSRDCMDCSLIGCQAERVYEGSVCGWGSSNLKFCWECWDGARDLEYSIACGAGAVDLFGCVGAMNMQYCILNKQYSKEEYFALRKKIIEHMDVVPYVDKQGRVYRYGEFFPPEFSPFSYQSTIVPEQVSMSEQEVRDFGLRWQAPNPTEYQTTLLAVALPDAIADAKDAILQEVIQCAQCKKAYRIIPPELQFLKQMNLPLPRHCVDCRHSERVSQRNRAAFYHRSCMKPGCANKFETSYAPDRPEIVYCETCYQQEVV